MGYNTSIEEKNMDETFENIDKEPMPEEHPGDRIKIKPDNPSQKSFYLAEAPPLSDFDFKLCNFFVMRKMRERFGNLPHNSEEHFPDPRIRRLTRQIQTS